MQPAKHLCLDKILLYDVIWTRYCYALQQTLLSQCYLDAYFTDTLFLF